MISKALVLITGANGHIGYNVVVKALESGYLVRAAVRGPEAEQKMRSGSLLKPFLNEPNQLTFVHVPDITTPSAYVDAARDCASIIHIAAPLPKVPGDLQDPAIQSVASIFAAAKANPSVKRLVFTSSIYALRQYEAHLPEHPHNEAMQYGSAEDQDRVPVLTGEEHVEVPEVKAGDSRMKEYAQAKIAARKAISDHTAMQEIDVIVLHLGFVVGPQELIKSKTESLMGSHSIFIGAFFPASLNPYFARSTDDQPIRLAAETVHISDCSEAHVNALDIPVTSSRGKPRDFLIVSDGPCGGKWDDLQEILKRRAPHIADQVPFPGRIGSFPSKFDAIKTEKELLGHKFRTLEEQFVDFASWMVTLPDA